MACGLRGGVGAGRVCLGLIRVTVGPKYKLIYSVISLRDKRKNVGRKVRLDLVWTGLRWVELGSLHWVRLGLVKLNEVRFQCAPYRVLS